MLNRGIRWLPLPLLMAITLAFGASTVADAHHKAGHGDRGAGQGMLRAFHNSPDTPAVDIWVNGERVLQAVEYGDLSDYLSLSFGDYEIEVKVFPSEAGDPAALKATVPVRRTPITVAAIGSLSGQGEPLQAKAYRDGSAPWLGFLSRLRVAHTSPDAPPVDVQVNLFGNWITVIPGLSFGESSGYLTLPALAFDFRAVVSGTDTVALDLPATQLPGGKAISVWAVNFVSDIGPFISVDGR